MRFGNISRKQSQERGQTIALVALTIVTLLAMAALAIDVVTLYVAKGEVQRAADAAALVAAKAFVDSGVTSDPANTSLQTLAENMATAGITAILPQNRVAGAAPVLVGTPTFCFNCPAYPYPGNPQVTVTLQRTGLPWSRMTAALACVPPVKVLRISSRVSSAGSLSLMPTRVLTPAVGRLRTRT